ncbi:MAG: hypothetical protein U0790_06410 [Isosphaeraceae bacterium]
MLALTLPWFVVVGVATRGEFFRFALGDQLLHRVTTDMEEHGGFPGYYASLSFLAMYPWSVLVPAAACAAWPRRRACPELAFLMGWLVGPWILLEPLPTRLLHYYLPAYPAWALLAAWFVEAVAAEDASIRRWPLGRLGLGLLGGIGVAGIIVPLGLAIALPGPLRAPLAGFGLLIGLGTMAATLRLHRGETRRAAFGLCLSWAAIMLLAGAWLVPSAEGFRMSRRVGQRLAALEARDGFTPALIDYKEPGVVYALGHPVPIIRGAESLDALLAHTDTLLTVLTPREAKVYRAKYGLSIEPVESLEGFSLTKGRGHVLQIATLRRPSARGRGPESVAGGLGVEQSLVK